MLDVGKDLVSHFKHSDLSTNALLEQQREINPTKPRKVIQTSWNNKVVSSLVDFERTILSTRKETVVETNISPFGLDADEAQRAKRSSQPLSLSLYKSKNKHRLVYWVIVVFWSRTSPLLKQRPLRDLEEDLMSATPSALGRGLIWRGKIGMMRCIKPCQPWLEQT